MKKVDFVKKFFCIILIVIFLLYVNHIFNMGFFGMLIEKYTLKIAACIVGIFTVIYVWDSVGKATRNFVYLKSQKIWQGALLDIDIGLKQECKKHVLELEENNIKFLKFGVQYFIVEKNEAQIYCILSMLRDKFYNKACCRDEISYFFLSSKKTIVYQLFYMRIRNLKGIVKRFLLKYQDAIHMNNLMEKVIFHICYMNYPLKFYI